MKAPRRVISLLPAATEIVCALGARDRLVGRSHECDFPPGVAILPVCSRPRMDDDGIGAVVERQVRDLVRRGLSVFEVLEHPLRALRPDLIVTQAQCELCAVSLSEVERAAASWTECAPSLVSLQASTLGDLLLDIQRTADALGVPERGQALVDDLRHRMRAIDVRASGAAGQLTVLCIEWVEPLMTAGNWVPELVALAGGEAVLARAGAHSPIVSWEDVARADPDRVVIMPCGFGLARARLEAARLSAQPRWQRLRAVTDGQVFVADGHSYFNRPGPRIAESLEILAECFHPQRFDFGHRGRGYAAF